MIKRVFLCLSLVGLCACDVFDYHPYDGRINQEVGRDMNVINLMDITNIDWNKKDSIRFIWFGDTGRSLDELEAFVEHANQNNSIDFAIHSGDLTEFGTTKEYEWGQERLKKLHFPYVVLIGNHDIIAYGDKIYEKMYGYQNFSFIVKDVLFLCLNTNAIEYDYSRPIPDFGFIKSTLQNGCIDSDSPQFKRTVVAMHAPPYNEQFNNNVAEIFHEKIKEYPSLLFCLHGHTHHFAGPRYFFEDDIPYYCCDNIGKRSYLIFTITPDDYSYELVKF